MDETVNRLVVRKLTTFNAGNITGEFLAVLLYDAADHQVSVQYDIRLLNGPPIGAVTMAVADVPNLMNVLKQAFAFALDHADEAIRQDVADMLLVTRGTTSPRHQ